MPRRARNIVYPVLRLKIRDSSRSQAAHTHDIVVVIVVSNRAGIKVVSTDISLSLKRISIRWYYS